MKAGILLFEASFRWILFTTFNVVLLNSYGIFSLTKLVLALILCLVLNTWVRGTSFPENFFRVDYIDCRQETMKASLSFPVLWNMVFRYCLAIFFTFSSSFIFTEDFFFSILEYYLSVCLVTN